MSGRAPSTDRAVPVPLFMRPTRGVPLPLWREAITSRGEMPRSARTWLVASEVALGPSPWRVCARPSCGMVWRSMSFVNLVDPPRCPMCGDRFTAARGRRLTRLLATAMRRLA